MTALAHLDGDDVQKGVQRMMEKLRQSCSGAPEGRLSILPLQVCILFFTSLLLYDILSVTVIYLYLILFHGTVGLKRIWLVDSLTMSVCQQWSHTKLSVCVWFLLHSMFVTLFQYTFILCS